MKYFKLNKHKEKTQWHEHFVLFPVCIGLTKDNDKIMVWGQKVLRCGTFNYCMYGGWWSFEYKELKRTNT